MKSKYQIPFNKPWLSGKELHYIATAIQDGHASGDGKYTFKCQRLLENDLYVPKVLLTTSCTDALEMAALLLRIKPGDEIIVPSFTFVSTANAFVLHGAKPIFADIRPDTMNIDENMLERIITRRTKAIIPVHYAGVGCEMDKILEIAFRHGIIVIEDNAHGLFAQYKEKYLGTFGSMATLSFHETKNYICGEGGALIINDQQYIERAEILREKGTNRRNFFKGQVDKYTWVDIGSSFLPSDILAAFLYAQLESRRQVESMRERVWNYYKENLTDWADKNNVQIPDFPDYCQHSNHMFYLILPSQKMRDSLISFLEKQGILSVFHYLPLHLSAMGYKFGGKIGDCPVAEDISSRLLRLPFYNEISESEQTVVVDAIYSWSSL